MDTFCISPEHYPSLYTHGDSGHSGKRLGLILRHVVTTALLLLHLSYVPHTHQSTCFIFTPEISLHNKVYVSITLSYRPVNQRSTSLVRDNIPRSVIKDALTISLPNVVHKQLGYEHSKQLYSTLYRLPVYHGGKHWESQKPVHLRFVRHHASKPSSVSLC